MREAADRLLTATEARRVELGKRWKQVYEEAGLTHQTLNRWRNGHPVEPLTERALERALLWGPGAREAIAAGREPSTLGGAGASADARAALRESEAAASSSLPSREVELVADIAASTAEKLGLSQAQAEEAFRRALRDIEAKREARERGQEPLDVTRRVG